DHGAEINALETESGQTPLIFAAAQNRVDAIRVLLKRGADSRIASKVLDVVAEGKLTAAARDRQTRVLASFGTKERETPSPSESQAAVLAARELYLAKDLPKDAKTDAAPAAAAPANAGNDDGRLPPLATKGGLTALLHAARQGYTDAAMVLIDGGADINQPS